MNKKQREACFREPGVDYTAADAAHLVTLLDKISEYQAAGAWGQVHDLREEVKAAALTFGHGASGRFLRVVLEPHPERKGEMQAVILSCRGDS